MGAQGGKTWCATFPLPPSLGWQESFRDQNTLVPTSALALQVTTTAAGAHGQPCFPWWNSSFSSFLVSDFWPLEPCSSFPLCLREGNRGGGVSYSNWKLLLPPNGFSNIRAGKLQLLSWHLPKLLVARPSPQPLELVGMELKTCVFPLMLLGLWALSDRMKRMFLGFDTCKNTPPSPWPCVAACQDRNKAKFSRVLSVLWPWLKWLPDVQQGRPKREKKCVVPWSPKPGVTHILDPDCGGLSPVCCTWLFNSFAGDLTWIVFLGLLFCLFWFKSQCHP